MTMRLNQGCHVPGEVDTRCRICGAAGNHQCFTVKEMMFGRQQRGVCLLQVCALWMLADFRNSHRSRQTLPRQLLILPDTIKKMESSPLYSWLQKQRCRTALFGQGVKINRLISRFVSLPNAWFDNGPQLKKAKFEGFDDGILDVGCGEHSSWLLNARGFGFNNLVGVDPFIKQDKLEFGINYFKKNLTELAGKFRYITFHHSLEHIPDQLAQLTAARHLLDAGGICLVRIPLVSSYVWEKYGVNWVELDAPRHLYLHSKESIKLLAEKAGFYLIDTICDSSEFEFAASEQYQAGIPLFDQRSYLVNLDKSIFTTQQMDAFKQEAMRVNANDTGGRAGFFFRVDK
ncbi:MAG: class I SAM-dependent methyltransferase [Candidatus Nitrotoga sp.]|nr:class I SAM-dependent methyltransferase [Candidatus Nitrotoga sp.]